MASRSRGLKSVGELLEQSQALRSAGRIGWHDWREVVGSKIAQRSRPEKVEDGTLWVIVTSAAWAQELSLLHRTIIGRLKGKGPPVSKLRFRVGRVEPLRPGISRLRPEPADLPTDLTAALDDLEDPALRSVIGDAARYNLGLRREKGTH